VKKVEMTKATQPLLEHAKKDTVVLMALLGQLLARPARARLRQAWWP
jgi:hypothetical protein